MASDVPKPVLPANVKEWVYIVDNGEQTVFECETPAKSNEHGTQPFDALFKSEVPVEKLSSEVETEAEYFGDDNIVEDRVAPEKAFETFLGCNFPTNQHADFSGSIYTVHPRVPQVATSHQMQGQALQGSESRAERLARLVREVDALSVECGLSAGEAASDAMNQLTDLRAQLRAIEQQFAHVPPSQPLTTIASSSSTSVSEGDDEDAGSSHSKAREVSVRMVSPAVAAVVALERRITTLEQSVGVEQLERGFDGASVAETLDDVRTRLALATDPTLPDRLKHDAKLIAGILKREMQSERGMDTLRVGTLLDKINDWQPVIDSLPIIVDRLASVRRLHDEAAHFVDAVNALTKQIDSIESRSHANQTLLNTVRHNLQVNMQTINENIDLLKGSLKKRNNSMASVN